MQPKTDQETPFSTITAALYRASRHHFVLKVFGNSFCNCARRRCHELISMWHTVIICKKIVRECQGKCMRRHGVSTAPQITQGYSAVSIFVVQSRFARCSSASHPSWRVRSEARRQPFQLRLEVGTPEVACIRTPDVAQALRCFSSTSPDLERLPFQIELAGPIFPSLSVGNEQLVAPWTWQCDLYS